MSGALSARCECGAVITLDAFRDEESLREFSISYLCQACQDDVYFRASASDATIRYPLRRGAIVAFADRGPELGVLPFLFVLPEPRIAWDSHRVVHAGAAIRELDPWDEMVVLESLVPHNQVRLVRVPDISAPEVRDVLDVDLIVVVDAAAERQLRRLPFTVGAHCGVLADVAEWRAVYGDLVPAVLMHCSRAEGPSVLAVCALLAVTLADDVSLAALVRDAPGRFPELTRSGPDDSG